MNGTALKSSLGVLLEFARRPSLSLRERLIRLSWERSQTVFHGGLMLKFITPSRTCAYRARSFSTKEPETLRWVERMAPDDVLWDVGANVGLYSIYAARRGISRVVAIEPSVFNLQALAQNIHLNEVSSVVALCPVAIASTSGTAELYSSTMAVGGAHSSFGVMTDQHGTYFTPKFTYVTLGLTLDDLVQVGYPAPTHLKIDVDGIEHLVLFGGPGVLSKVQSCLIELTDAYEEQSATAARLLTEAGLHLVERHDIGVVGMSNQVWARRPVSAGVTSDPPAAS